MCIYGYALTVFIPAAILCIVSPKLGYALLLTLEYSSTLFTEYMVAVVSFPVVLHSLKRGLGGGGSDPV